MANEKVEYATTLNQQAIYIRLVDFPNFKFPLTQTQVARNLGIAKSTVNYAVDKFEKLDIIRHRYNAVSDILYERGNMAYVIENDINSRKFVKTCNDRQGVTLTLKKRHHWRMHLNGGAITFTVTNEGKIWDTVWNGRHRPIFSTAGKPYHNSVNYYGSFSPDLKMPNVAIRYQKTPKMKILYITPSSQYVSIEDMGKGEQDINNRAKQMLIDSCRPVLDFLVKYAGWNFLCDMNYNYIPRPFDVVKDSRIEWAGDQSVTKIAKKVIEKYPMLKSHLNVGHSKVYLDKSGHSQNGECEIEFNDANILKAFIDVPKTRNDTERLSVQMDEVIDAHNSLFNIVYLLITELNGNGIELSLTDEYVTECEQKVEV